MTTVQLHGSDAAELAEPLTFIDDWLTRHPDMLRESLRGFVGNTGYTIETLHADFARFSFLLGYDNGEQLFGEQSHDRSRADQTSE
ncbi:MAG TPA: hypothetical protein VGJ38_14460 [Jatrophihabitantaceae bacterium]|jgi:hypothetical protein